MVSADWEPAQYLRFAAARARPFFDLLAPVFEAFAVRRSPPARIVDLGCGPGTLTAELGRRYPDARVTGVDRSPAMLERARRLAQRGHLEFLEQDLRAYEPDGEVDLLVANAVLQWVPEHRELLARLASWLVPGGFLAFQVPDAMAQPSHRLIDELCAREPWRSALSDMLDSKPSVARPEDYLERLMALGLEANVWETTYHHVLSGDDPVFAWVRGTTLVPILARLPSELGATFCEQLRGALAQAYPMVAGRTVLAFRRIFVIGQQLD